MKPHEEWLYKAIHDLKSAEHLMTAPVPLYDVAIYHTQQCAEKSFKAYLAYREQEIEKIHHLVVLLNLCARLNGAFQELKEEALFLNPYSTLFRYPEGELMPSLSELLEAIAAAKKIYDFVSEEINRKV